MILYELHSKYDGGAQRVYNHKRTITLPQGLTSVLDSYLHDIIVCVLLKQYKYLLFLISQLSQQHPWSKIVMVWFLKNLHWEKPKYCPLHSLYYGLH